MLLKKQIHLKLAVLFSLLCVLTACRQHRDFTIATYNVYFLDDEILPERKHNLQEVIRLLDADVIAFQEIASPAALKNILSDEYEIAMFDDPQEVQELALAVRSPVKIISSKYAFPDTSLDDAFPRVRDLLEVEVEFYRRRLVFLVHHAKSRSGGRIATDFRREKAANLIVEYIRSNLKGQNVVLIGDFNDNPDDQSLNILEYGDSTAEGGIDSIPDSFLYNTSEMLLSNDYCSYGYSYLFETVQDDTFKLNVEGSRAENNKWRDREHNYFEDVKVKAILFDQILVSMNLQPYVSKSGIFNSSVAIRGERSRIRFVDGQLQYTKRGALASDHVPVWVVLEF